MRVLFAAAEASPLVKTGGLGDVAYALPTALAKLGVDIRIIVPKYRAIPEAVRRQAKALACFHVPVAGRNQYCGLEELEWGGLKYYLLDNEYYFGREQLYGYYDDAERFGFFCLAACACLDHLGGFWPDIVHCNDWHTALIPLFLRRGRLSTKAASHPSTVFTIHNLAYQGIFPRTVLADVLGLGDEYFAMDKMEFHGVVNYLKTGLVYADCLTTVSPSYAQEIQTPYLGEGLDGVLRAKSHCLHGILNGLEQSQQDPERAANPKVSLRGALARKAEHKLKLQSLVHLPQAREVPLLGIVSRLVEPKGWDLLTPILHEILTLDLQIAVLGTGESKYETMFADFAARYPQKLAARIMFDEGLARCVYAGTDLFLMPSRFEPCGLAQMIAMSYGAVPLVRETGGLKDTVIPYNQYTGEGNGFSFANYNAHELLFTIQRAVNMYHNDKVAWGGLVVNALQADFSPEKSARQYLAVYQELRKTRMANV